MGALGWPANAMGCAAAQDQVEEGQPGASPVGNASAATQADARRSPGAKPAFPSSRSLATPPGAPMIAVPPGRPELCGRAARRSSPPSGRVFWEATRRPKPLAIQISKHYQMFTHSFGVDFSWIPEARCGATVAVGIGSHPQRLFRDGAIHLELPAPSGALICR